MIIGGPGVHSGRRGCSAYAGKRGGGDDVRSVTLPMVVQSLVPHAKRLGLGHRGAITA